MATIDKEKNKIIWSDDDKENAWNNAIILSNKDPLAFRMCYICKFHMEKEINMDNYTNETESFAWDIDLINIKKPDLIGSNLIAVHNSCIGNREKADETKRIKKIKMAKWEYKELD